MMSPLILTRDQVRRIDRKAIDEYGMPGIILMENAGRNAAEIVQDKYTHLEEQHVGVFCGPGNNGGDGFVIVRHLHNAGWSVRVVLICDPDKLKGDALINYQIVRAMTIPIEPIAASDEVLSWCTLVIDALFGTGFSGQVREPAASLIDRMNASGRPIVAVDVPSGLDCASGTPADNTIRAELTITFVAVKSGLATPSAGDYVGRVVAADIGVPKELIETIAAED